MNQNRYRLIGFLSYFLVNLSICSAAGDSFKKMAKDLARGLRAKDAPRVALLAFPYHDGRVSSGSSILSERLTTHMGAVKGIRVVERNLIKKLLEEQHLSETGIIDSKTAQQMGKVLGVNVIITGTLIDLNDNETEVNARAIKAGTGEVLSASRSVVRRFWQDKPRFPVQPGQNERSAIDADPEPEITENEAIKIGPPGGRGSRGGGYSPRY